MLACKIKANSLKTSHAQDLNSYYYLMDCETWCTWPSLNKIVCDFKVKQTDAIKTVSKQLVDNFRIGHEQFLIFDFLLYTHHNESCEINKKYNFYKFFTVRDGPELGSGTSKSPELAPKMPGAGSQNARSWPPKRLGNTAAWKSPKSMGLKREVCIYSGDGGGIVVDVMV